MEGPLPTQHPPEAGPHCPILLGVHRDTPTITLTHRPSLSICHSLPRAPRAQVPSQPPSLEACTSHHTSTCPPPPRLLLLRSSVSPQPWTHCPCLCPSYVVPEPGVGRRRGARLSARWERRAVGLGVGDHRRQCPGAAVQAPWSCEQQCLKMVALRPPALGRAAAGSCRASRGPAGALPGLAFPVQPRSPATGTPQAPVPSGTRAGAAMESPGARSRAGRQGPLVLSA